MIFRIRTWLSTQTNLQVPSITATRASIRYPVTIGKTEFRLYRESIGHSPAINTYHLVRHFHCAGKISWDELLGNLPSVKTLQLE